MLLPKPLTVFNTLFIIAISIIRKIKFYFLRFLFLIPQNIIYSDETYHESHLFNLLIKLRFSIFRYFFAEY